MDPLSIAAGVFGLTSSIMTLSQRLNELRRDFVAAAADIDGFNKELTAFSTVLSQLQNTNLAFPTTSMSSDLSKILGDINRVLFNAEKHLETASTRTLRRMSWALSGRQGYRSICRELESYKLTLVIAIAVSNMLHSENQEAREQLNDCGENIQSVHFNTTLLHSNPTLRRFLHDAESVAESVRGSVAVTSDVQSGDRQLVIRDHLPTHSLDPVSNPPSHMEILPSLPPMQAMYPVPQAYTGPVPRILPATDPQIFTLQMPDAYRLAEIQTTNERAGNYIDARISSNPSRTSKSQDRVGIVQMLQALQNPSVSRNQLQLIVERSRFVRAQVKVVGNAPLGKDAQFNSYPIVLHGAISPDARHVAVILAQTTTYGTPERVYMALFPVSEGISSPYEWECGKYNGHQEACVWFAKEKHLNAISAPFSVADNKPTQFIFSEWMQGSGGWEPNATRLQRSELNIASPCTPLPDSRALIYAEMNTIKSVGLNGGGSDWQRSSIFQIAEDKRRSVFTDPIRHISLVSGLTAFLVTRPFSVKLANAQTNQCYTWTALDLGLEGDDRCSRAWLMANMKTMLVGVEKLPKRPYKYILFDVSTAAMELPILGCYNNNTVPAISSDGSFLVVQHGSDAKLSLHIIDALDGRVKLKISCGGSMLHSSFTAITPDGKTIVWADNPPPDFVYTRPQVCCFQF